MVGALSSTFTTKFWGMEGLVMQRTVVSGRASSSASASSTTSRSLTLGGTLVRAPTRCRDACHVPMRAAPLHNKPKLSYVGARASEGMSPDKTQWGEQFRNLTPPPLTKTDEHFASLGLEFVETREGIVLPELNDLFERVGFPRRDPAKLKVALENTYALVWVRSTKQSRLARLGQMVGFARATSDGVLSATIWDVAVLPAWQRSGLGRAMMERLTRKLVANGIPTITLYAEPNVVAMYERLGFVKDPEGIKGMAFQKQRKELASSRR